MSIIGCDIIVINLVILKVNYYYAYHSSFLQLVYGLKKEYFKLAIRKQFKILFLSSVLTFQMIRVCSQINNSLVTFDLYIVFVVVLVQFSIIGVFNENHWQLTNTQITN